MKEDDLGKSAGKKLVARKRGKGVAWLRKTGEVKALFPKSDIPQNLLTPFHPQHTDILFKKTQSYLGKLLVSQAGFLMSFIEI